MRPCCPKNQLHTLYHVPIYVTAESAACVYACILATVARTCGRNIIHNRNKPATLNLSLRTETESLHADLL